MLLLGSLLLATFVAAPVAGAGATTQAAHRQDAFGAQSADLRPALTRDGTFVGAPGLAGTVDMGAWSLVSDPTSGKPPRFAPATSIASTAAAGSWSALGDDGTGDGALNYAVYAVVVSGGDVYVGGGFTDAAGMATADYVAKWDGSAWSALGDNGVGATDGALDGVVSGLAISGTDLFVSGSFGNAGGIATADYVAKWDGTDWSALGDDGAGDGALDGPLEDVAVSGGDVYVGGFFTDAAGIATADYVAKWDGGTWSGLGDDSAGDGAITSLVVTLEVIGTDVYVGGFFTDVAGIAAADYVARWNGFYWSPLGDDGAGDGAITNNVIDLTASGSDLYVGGWFADAAGIPFADFVAKWDGVGWSALGDNGADNGALNFSVYSVAVSGSDVYVGGGFTDVAGIATADYLARFDGTDWSAMGDNGAGNGAFGDTVIALATSGTDLYAGGFFSDGAGIAAADYIAKWTQAQAAAGMPDASIRKRNGAFVGDNIYNTTGTDQARTGSAARRRTITFGVSIQNDDLVTDSFTVLATGAATTTYRVRYFAGTTDITAAVVAGTFTTPALAAGDSYRVTVKVKVKSTAAADSDVTRLVTVTSAGDGTTQDAVMLVAKRR
jgi:hypothetical protein